MNAKKDWTAAKDKVPTECGDYILVTVDGLELTHVGKDKIWRYETNCEIMFGSTTSACWLKVDLDWFFNKLPK